MLTYDSTYIAFQSEFSDVSAAIRLANLCVLTMYKASHQSRIRCFLSYFGKSLKEDYIDYKINW